MSRAFARRVEFSDDQPTLPIFPPAPIVVPARRVPVRAHLRSVTGPTPASGPERRDRALNDLAARAATQRAVAYVRERLIALYHERAARTSDPYVTADDVEAMLREWPECPDEAKPSHGPQHWRGTVFRGKGWRQTGRHVPSTRPHMNATALPCWALTHPTENP
jgi:hypothetical protein